MKESIEKKLGCTIDQYIAQTMNGWDTTSWKFTEKADPLVKLSCEEMEYFELYLKKKIAYIALFVPTHKSAV